MTHGRSLSLVALLLLASLTLCGPLREVGRDPGAAQPAAESVAAGVGR